MEKIPQEIPVAQTHLKNEPVHKNVLNQRGSFLLILGAVVIILVVLGAGGYLLTMNKNSNSNQNIPQPNSQKEGLPKLAYLDMPKNPNNNGQPDDIIIYTTNIDGSEKKLFTKIQTHILRRNQYLPPSLVFSPLSRELIANTDSEIIAIKLDSGQKRILYKGDVDGLYISDENKYLYFSDGERRILQLDSLKVDIVGQCDDLRQPYWDERTNIGVGLKLSPGDSSDKTSVITVCNDRKPIKKFSYKKGIVPLFIKDNYLYFLSESSVNVLNSFQKINLNTGDIIAANDLTELSSNLSKNWRAFLGHQVTQNHFIYEFTPLSSSLSSDERVGTLSLIDYNIQTGKQMVIKSFDNADLPNSRIDVQSWSKNGKYLIFSTSVKKPISQGFGSIDEGTYMYNFGATENKNVGSLYPYIFLE